jgi:spoIIIJ-associated protein
VKPAQARPKQERRRRGREKSGDKSTDKSTDTSARADAEPSTDESDTPTSSNRPARTAETDGRGQDEAPARPARARRSPSRASQPTPDHNQEQPMSSDDRPESTVTPQEVGEAAVAFMNGLTTAFGASGTAELRVDDLELEVQVSGTELGLLVGPGGRTLNAIQDLARVAAQRRLGDHETRLRIDVAGYRERREAALAKFARDVAGQVRETGSPRSLEPMTSADRKVIHDVLNEEEGVQSRSEGEDPTRRIIVEPA